MTCNTFYFPLNYVYRHLSFCTCTVPVAFIYLDRAQQASSGSGSEWVTFWFLHRTCIRQRIHDVVLESIGSSHLVKQVQERCDCDHFDRLVRVCDHFTMVVVDPLEAWSLKEKRIFFETSTTSNVCTFLEMFCLYRPCLQHRKACDPGERIVAS